MLSGCSRLIPAATAPSCPSERLGVSAASAVVPAAAIIRAASTAAADRCIILLLFMVFPPVSAAGISRQLVLAPGCCPMNPLYRSRPIGSIWSCYHFVIIFVPEKPPIPWQNKKTGPPIGEVLSDSVRRKQLGYRPVSGFTLLPPLPVFPVLPGLLTLLDELLDEEELLSSFSGCEIAFFSGRSEAM